MLFHIKLWIKRLSRLLQKVSPGRLLLGVLLVLALVVVMLVSLIRPKGDPLDSAEILAIKNRGALRVAVRGSERGFGFLDEESGEYSGLEADIAREICARIFGDPEKVEFVRVNARTATERLAMNEADIVLALKTARETRYAATSPYYIDAFATMVLGDTYAKYEDLNGRRIGVVQEIGASKPEQPPTFLAMEELAKSRKLTFDYRVYASYPELKEALEARAVDAIVFPTAYLPRYYDSTKSMISEAISQEPYCALVRKTDQNLLEIADSVIKDMASSGALGALYAKYSLPVFGKTG